MVGVDGYMKQCRVKAAAIRLCTSTLYECGGERPVTFETDESRRLSPAGVKVDDAPRLEEEFDIERTRRKLVVGAKVRVWGLTSDAGKGFNGRVDTLVRDVSAEKRQRYG